MATVVCFSLSSPPNKRLKMKLLAVALLLVTTIPAMNCMVSKIVYLTLEFMSHFGIHEPLWNSCELLYSNGVNVNQLYDIALFQGQRFHVCVAM